ncbi:MAG: HAD family hydrolase [Oscillospiraceae bacterium]|nr:HAD family hydrolase [Oscillospiraceae bacterium]
MKTIIFDLDGTLLDTLADLSDSANYTMDKMGYPTYPLESYRYFVGNGVPKLLERCLPEDKRTDENIQAARTIFADYYNVHFADKTKPYEGIFELLECLGKSGVKMAVASNKSDEFTVSLAKRFFGNAFDMVQGGKADVPKKPAPDIVYGIMDSLGAVPENTYFAGDSNVDMYTAKNAGIKAIGCLWGFRTKEELLEGGADFLAEKSSDIYDIIMKRG